MYRYLEAEKCYVYFEKFVKSERKNVFTYLIMLQFGRIIAFVHVDEDYNRNYIEIHVD